MNAPDIRKRLEALAGKIADAQRTADAAYIKDAHTDIEQIMDMIDKAPNDDPKPTTTPAPSTTARPAKVDGNKPKS